MMDDRFPKSRRIRRIQAAKPKKINLDELSMHGKVRHVCIKCEDRTVHHVEKKLCRECYVAS
jgi:hypothetical protein